MTTNANAPEQAVDQQQVLRDLLALGKKNGRLTLKEIADALSQLEMESDDIDKLYETLETMGVEIETGGVLEKALGDDDDEVFEPEDVEEVPEEELIDTSAMAETFAIDDPVRMYLKEIGKVDLLSPEEEVTLAEQMRKGNEAAARIEAEGDAIPADERAALDQDIKTGEKAKKRLAEANLRLVVSIAKRYVVRGTHVDPRKLLPGEGLFPHLRRVAAIDADEFDGRPVFRIGLFHGGHPLHTPTAPSAPEVEHDVFSLPVEGREDELFAVSVGQREIGGDSSRFYRFAGLLGGDQFVGQLFLQVEPLFEGALADAFVEPVIEAVETGVVGQGGQEETGYRIGRVRDDIIGLDLPNTVAQVPYLEVNGVVGIPAVGRNHHGRGAEHVEPQLERFDGPGRFPPALLVGRTFEGVFDRFAFGVVGGLDAGSLAGQQEQFHVLPGAVAAEALRSEEYAVEVFAVGQVDVEFGLIAVAGAADQNGGHIAPFADGGGGEPGADQAVVGHTGDADAQAAVSAAGAGAEQGGGKGEYGDEFFHADMSFRSFYCRPGTDC